jgi:putative redox protein
MSENKSTIIVDLERISGQYLLKATNQRGYTMETEGSPGTGGDTAGFRPTELLLVALGSCAATDIILILEKQRQELRDIRIHIEGIKEKVSTYSEYKIIEMHFDLYGKIKPKKAEQAIELGVRKYCTVAKLLEKTAEITYKYTIHE